MTEPKFTPAPWMDDYFVVLGSNCLPIATITVLNYENAKANANLIVSAPEMYCVLEETAHLLRDYELINLQKGDRIKANQNRRYAERCEKVLAKARGET